MSAKPIQIVDANDEPVGSTSITEAQEQGLIHRIARVMVEDDAGRILLQKRREDKRTYPSCWDNSGSGHVDAGETYETAAARELAEEVGISGFPLEEIDYYRTTAKHKGKQLDRFNKLYKTVVPVGTTTEIQEDEVSQVKWFTLGEIQALPKNETTDGLVDAIKRLYS